MEIGAENQPQHDRAANLRIPPPVRAPGRKRPRVAKQHSQGEHEIAEFGIIVAKFFNGLLPFNQHEERGDKGDGHGAVCQKQHGGMKPHIVGVVVKNLFRIESHKQTNPLARIEFLHEPRADFREKTGQRLAKRIGYGYEDAGLGCKQDMEYCPEPIMLHAVMGKYGHSCETKEPEIVFFVFNPKRNDVAGRSCRIVEGKRKVCAVVHGVKLIVQPSHGFIRKY